MITWIKDLLTKLVAGLNFGQLLSDAIVKAIADFDMVAFVTQYGDTVATAIVDKFNSDPAAKQALIQKILDKLLG